VSSQASDTPTAPVEPLAPPEVKEPSDAHANEFSDAASYEEVKQEKKETSLAAQLEDAREHLEEIRRFKTQADKAFKEATAEVDRLIEANEKTGVRETLADQLGGYFARQQLSLQQRAEHLQRIRDSGLTLKDLKSLLPSRSPIDNAFARKTSRGGQRPKV
jgi:hypothetical protein